MPKYLLTNKKLGLFWKLLEKNPLYSEDVTTKARVGTAPADTRFDLIPGTVSTGEATGFLRVDDLTLDSDETNPWACVIVDNYLYIGLQTEPTKIVKVDLSTFTKVATLTLESGENYVWDLAVSGNYLYVQCDTRPVKIVKVDLSTFTRVGVLTLSYDEYAGGLAVDGNYLYSALYSYPTIIVKIDLSTFEEVSSLTLDEDEDECWMLKVYGGYLYACLDTSPGMIVKIDLSTFTKVSTLTLTEGNFVESAAIYEGYLYAGLWYPAIIAKIDLSTFTKVGSLTLEEEDCNALTAHQGFLYAATDYPFRIVAIDLSTFTRVATLTPKTDEECCYYTSLVASGSYLYAAVYTSPDYVTRIVKILIKPVFGWITEQPLTGTLASGRWTFKVKLRNDTPNPFSVKVVAKILKVREETEELVHTVESPNVLTLPAQAGAPVFDTFTWDAPEVDFNGYQLNVRYSLRIVTPGSSADCQCSFVCNENPLAAEESVEIPGYLTPPPSPPTLAGTLQHLLVTLMSMIIPLMMILLPLSLLRRPKVRKI